MTTIGFIGSGLIGSTLAVPMRLPAAGRRVPELEAGTTTVSKLLQQHLPTSHGRGCAAPAAHPSGCYSGCSSIASTRFG
jgi:hypothetical protein